MDTQDALGIIPQAEGQGMAGNETGDQSHGDAENRDLINALERNTRALERDAQRQGRLELVKFFDKSVGDRPPSPMGDKPVVGNGPPRPESNKGWTPEEWASVFEWYHNVGRDVCGSLKELALLIDRLYTTVRNEHSKYTNVTRM